MNRPFEHQEVPIAVRVAQAVGITATAFIAGTAPFMLSFKHLPLEVIDFSL